MPILVEIPPGRRASAEAAALIAEYTAFDRARAERKPWIHASVGFAVAILAGSAAGRLPAREALVGAATFGAPAVPLLLAEMIGWRRLRRRLASVRAGHCRIRKS